MAKFIFKMQNILEVKLKLEDQAKTVYASAVEALEREKEKQRQLEEKKESYEERLTELMYESLKVSEICRMENAVEIMKYRIHEQMIAVRNAQLQLDKAQKKLHEAMVERKTYEKLKEKAFEEFKLEVNAQEKKEVDELVSYTYSRPREQAAL